MASTVRRPDEVEPRSRTWRFVEGTRERAWLRFPLEKPVRRHCVRPFTCSRSATLPAVLGSGVFRRHAPFQALPLPGTSGIHTESVCPP